MKKIKEIRLGAAVLAACVLMPMDAAGICAVSEQPVQREVLEDGALSLCAAAKVSVEKAKGDGWCFEDGTLMVSKIYYTVLEVAGNRRCMYEKPWFSYESKIKKLIIDADMVYTKTNHQTGAAYVDVVSNKTPFQGGDVLFGNMSSLQAIDIRHLDTKEITDISNMFANNANVTSILVSDFRTPKVTNVTRLFYGNKSLKKISLQKMNAKRFQNAEAMFENCTALKSVGISSWNTKKIKSFQRMFSNCSALTSINLSGWTINNANVAGMFWGCKKLKSVKLSKVTLTDTIAANAMFDKQNAITDYAFAKSWKVDGVYPIGEFPYSKAVVPVRAEPPAIIETLQYSKVMPTWYKQQVERTESVDKGTKIYASPKLDIYYVEQNNGKESALVKGEIPFDEIADNFLDMLEKEGIISSEQCQTIKDGKKLYFIVTSEKKQADKLKELADYVLSRAVEERAGSQDPA